MRFNLFATIFLATFLIASNSIDGKVKKESVSTKNNNLTSSIKKRSLARTTSREVGTFFSVLIDSSKNGYGAFRQHQSPLAYSYDANDGGEKAGWVAVYRQFGSSITETAGLLGIAQTTDPEMQEWSIDQKVNSNYPELQYTYTWDPTGGADNTGSGSGLPTPDGSPGARYPNALISSFTNKPMAVWNEYTTPAYGGGESGGVPMFAVDAFKLDNEQSNFALTGLKHLNNSCRPPSGPPCDPPDLWYGNAQLIDGNDGLVRVLALYQSWAAHPQYGDWYPQYMIKSLNVVNGYIFADDINPNGYVQQDSLTDVDNLGDCLWDDCSANSWPDFHVNNNGVGYMGLAAFTADSLERPFSQSLFFKQTTDFGQSWSSDEGFKNSGYYYLTDEVLYGLHDSLLTLWSSNPDDYPGKPWYPWATDSTGQVVGDTIQFSDDTSSLGVQYNYFYPDEFYSFRNFDILSDNDNGLHITATAWTYLCKDDEGGCADYVKDGNSSIVDSDSIFLDIRFPGSGMYHYYNPDPIDQPNNWTATFIDDYSDSYSADWPDETSDNDMRLYVDEWNFFEPNVRPSYEEGSEVLWYAATKMSSADSNDVPTDIDIFMSKSVDNGRTWTEVDNVTNTLGLVGGDPLVEYGHHLANIGTDNEIGIFYQMPKFGQEFLTVSDDEGFTDYVNRVYVGKYTNYTESLNVIESDEKSVVPSSFVLKQNYPNPFNPITKISYGIDIESDVKISLYDIRGGFVQTLINKKTWAGNHDLMFDASHLSSGVYFYTMTVNGVSQTKKLVLMK